MAGNTHAVPDVGRERQAWFGDVTIPYVHSGGLPTVPSSSLTFGTFATAGYIRGASNDLVYVTQEAAAVGPLNGGDGTYWLAFHRDLTTSVSSWTRQTGTHYLWRKTASLPSNPSGGLIICSVTVAGGVITVVTDYRLPESYGRARVLDVTDPLYGAVGDGVSDDTVAVQLALNASYTLGHPVHLPQGTYLTSSTLVVLHSGVLTGPGGIKRGSDTFYPNPTSAQSNVLYVATTGSNANDGLTSSQPLATLAQALGNLAHYGPALEGTWTIKLAAGTYAQGAIDFPVILGNRNRVVIQGPIVNHPNVPTAVFDDSGGSAYGLNFNSRAYVTVSNLKFQNYTTYGVVGQDLGDLTCVNVHAASIAGGPGIKMQQGRLRVQGGIITACQEGIECIGGTTFTIGDPASASTANGTQITNCTQCGVLAQEQSSGHIDYVTIDNCAVGCDIVIHSRVHANHSIVKNNATAGFRCRQASDWLDNNTFANFTGNTNNELTYSYSGEVGRDGARTSLLRGANDQTLITTTGVFAAAVVKTYTGYIAADTFNNETKGYRIVIYGTITGTTNTKNITVNVAGSAAFGHTVAAGVTGDFVMDGTIYPHGTSGSQQSYHSTLQVEGQTCKVQQGSRSITCVTGAALDVTILNTVNGAGDTVVIRAVQHYYLGAC